MSHTLEPNEKLLVVARETIRIAEHLKVEDKNPMLLMFARAVVRQDEEIQRLKSTLDMVEKGDSAKMNAQVDEINTLKDKLSTLREKYRWRKQSEEPAPNCLVETYQSEPIQDLLIIPGQYLHKKCCWRPLDLPEAEM